MFAETEEEIRTEIQELKDKFEVIRDKGWIKNNCKGRTSIGITFENELGKTIEKFEIKCKNIGYKEHMEMTLFCATSDSYLL